MTEDELKQQLDEIQESLNEESVAQKLLKRIDELEQENKQMKEEIEAFKTMATVPTRMYNECERERCRYGRALEEIRNDIMTNKSVCTECIKIAKRIDEVLQ